MFSVSRFVYPCFSFWNADIGNRILPDGLKCLIPPGETRGKVVITSLNPKGVELYIYTNYSNGIQVLLFRNEVWSNPLVYFIGNGHDLFQIFLFPECPMFLPVGQQSVDHIPFQIGVNL